MTLSQELNLKESSSSNPPQRESEPGAAPFVWTVWLAMAVLIIVYTALYTANIPWCDEWYSSTVLAGERPVTPSWLWEQNNEHRIPLPRLIWIASLRASDNDFRLLPLLDSIGLAWLAFGMIRTARRLRGWIAYTDAFLPLLILNPAQYGNLVWAFQIGFILPVILSGILLILIVSNAKSGVLRTWKGAAAALTCLVLLPFCAAVGLAFGTALSLWFDYTGYQYRRSTDVSLRRKAWLFLAGGLFCPLMVVLYLHGLTKPTQIPASPSLSASLTTGMEFLSGAFGQGAGTLGWPLLGIVVLLLLCIGMAVSLRAWRRGDSGAAGVLLLMAATIGVAFALGHARAGLGRGSGWAPRYVTLMAPGLCGLYFAWQAYTPPNPRRFLQISLFTISYLLMPMNVREALEWGRGHMNGMASFEKDLRAGTPAAELASRYEAFLGQPADVTARFMPILQRGRIGLFRELKVVGVGSAAAPVVAVAPDVARAAPADAVAPRPPASAEGFVDVADEHEVAGWAWDKSRPDAPVSVDILDGDKLLARISASQFRPDLLKAHLGNGNHAFSYKFPQGSGNGPRNIRVLPSGTNVALPFTHR